MPKSDQEKADIRQQTEARRQADKDRTGHEAARGKALSLSDLSRNDIQDEHVSDIIHELDNQTDRGAALIAAALLDTALRRTMSTRLAHFNDFERIIFESEGAPLGSFFARIKVARALGVIGEVAEVHLDAIRRIRNQFAHSAFRIDFENELIAAEVDKLLPDTDPEWKPQFSPARRRYIGTAIDMMRALDALSKEHIQDTIPVWLDLRKPSE